MSTDANGAAADPSGESEETEAGKEASTRDEPGGLSWLERRHAGRIARGAEKIAVERLTEAREQLEQGLEATISTAAAESAQVIETRLEKARAGFGEVLQGGRDTIRELRNQVSAAGEQRARLEDSAAEIRAQAAAAEDTVGAATDKAIKELTAQADERVKLMSEGVQEATDLADVLRKEFSVRIDSAVGRLDRSAEDLEVRAEDVKDRAEELNGKMQSARERVASWEQKIGDQIEKAVAALKAEGDRQTERLDARIEALETQRLRLQQQTSQIQKESGEVRERAVELEELVKTATGEVANRVGAAQRELDFKLEASKELVAAAAENREQERELWEQTRTQVADELDRTTKEIREFFLVQLAAVRSRIDAIAEASGLAPPPVEKESSFSEWVPSQTTADRTGSVDLNSAGVSELRSLDLTMTQARRLIEHRERIGGFTSVDQVDDVPGFTRDQRAGVKRRASVR